MKNKLYFFGSIAAIIALVVPIAQLVLEETFVTGIIAAVLGVVVFSATFMLGKKHKNKLLQVMSILLIIGSIFSLMLPQDLLTETEGPIAQVLPELIIALTVFIVAGILITLFGVALLQLRKKYKKPAAWAGWLHLILGICMITVIGAILSAVLYIPATIALAVLLFKAAKLK